MQLSASQQRAVERRGQDVAVVAGPGSGKTRVLIERFAWLVERQRADASRILAITFTEKAATEIRERLIRRFADRFELREQIERAWVSTIHGFCTRLLKEHAVAAGLAPDFTVLDEAEMPQLQREAADQALEALYRERPANTRRLLEALDLSTQEDGRQPDLARALLDAYEAMRISGCRELPVHPPATGALDGLRAALMRVLAEDPAPNTPNQHAAHARFQEWARTFLALPPEAPARRRLEVLAGYDISGSHLRKGTLAREAGARIHEEFPALLVEEINAPLGILLRDALVRIDAEYRARKRSRAALDFDDLQEQAIRLLERETAIREAVRDRFDQILMDELQDTNPLQWRLVNLIRRPGRFFAVGDINQSIYGFRHAEPAVFRDYRDALAAAGREVDDLEENHRSRREILDAVGRVLRGQPGIEPRPLTPKFEFPPKSEPSVELLIGRGESGPEVEANLVARRIRELEGRMLISEEDKQRPLQFRDIAVLVRALGALEPIERALDRYHVPHLVTGGRTFLEAREVRDVMQLLAVLVNPLDTVAMAGVLRSPLVGLSEESILRWSSGLAVLADDDREGLEGFNRLLNELRPLAGAVSPDRMIVRFLDHSGYEEGCTERARANIEKFLAHLRRRHESRSQPLAELLEDLEKLRAAEAEAEAPPAESGNVVRLMSIHAAKGLEFPVVFVAALHRGVDRRSPVVLYSPEHGLGVKWRNPVTGKGHSDRVHRAYKDVLKRKQEAEEDRLLYVAMTRAREHLVLSYAEPRKGLPVWPKLVSGAIAPTVAADAIPEVTAALIATPPPPAGLFTDRPAAVDQYDSTAAVTSVAMFGDCPRRYYLSRYLRLSPSRTVPGEEYAEPLDEIGATELGTEVHAILAGTAVDRSHPEAAELAARFHASELGRRVARAQRAEREFDFLLAIEDVVLNGKIDLWFEEGGELVLVDYKTDRDQSGTRTYALQLRLYALALQHHIGRLPDAAYLDFLRADALVAVDLTEARLQEARDTVREFREAQSALRFPLEEALHCLRCEFFRGLCTSAYGRGGT